MMLLAIDPGNEQSAYCLMDGYHCVDFGKLPNAELLEIVLKGEYKFCAIEMVESYGMAVGKEVFQTCVWIGRFSQAAISVGIVPNYVTRKEVKLNLCGTNRAKDTNVRQALIDRFASFDLRTGKGTKKQQDFFYGFHADVWAAYAVGATWLDKEGA